MARDPDCIFCKIVAGEIPSKKAYEDAEMLAFHDIAPWAPAHLLIIPKEHLADFYAMTEAHTGLLGRMFAKAPLLMRQLGVTNGFRTLVNTGADGLQEVPHFHVHVMGGPRPWAKG